MIIQIPFSGFYESIHSSNIEHELYDCTFTDRATGCDNNDRLSDLVYDSINFHNLHLDYAKEYSLNFSAKYNLNLAFERMTSPREYNFATDRIFCEISVQQIHALFENTGSDFIDKHARAMFTSCDGLMSFYDNNWCNWGDVLTWDYNQLHCLLLAWLECNHETEDYYGDAEIDLMDNCNGFFSDLIYTHCTNKRIFKISDYLNTRAERVVA